MTYYPPPPVGWEYAVLHVVHPDHPRQEIPTALDRFIDGLPHFMDEDCKKECLTIMVKKRPTEEQATVSEEIEVGGDMIENISGHYLNGRALSIADFIIEDEGVEDEDWHPCVLTGQFTAECQGECRE